MAPYFKEDRFRPRFESAYRTLNPGTSYSPQTQLQLKDLRSLNPTVKEIVLAYDILGQIEQYTNEVVMILEANRFNELTQQIQPQLPGDGAYTLVVFNPGDFGGGMESISVSAGDQIPDFVTAPDSLERIRILSGNGNVDSDPSTVSYTDPQGQVRQITIDTRFQGNTMSGDAKEPTTPNSIDREPGGPIFDTPPPRPEGQEQEGSGRFDPSTLA